MTSRAATVTVGPTALRARFATTLSRLYGTEVPAYTTLVQVSWEVNERARHRLGAAADRLGTLDRITAERHGAIRVGTPEEMRQVARIFGALGMHPVGFYDLRDAAPTPIPVVSTAFRPIDGEELAVNPFRVFTSMLVPQDRRFFDADLERRLGAFLARRRLFPPELLGLADRAVAGGGLPEADARRFLDLAAAAFALSAEPVDRAWYRELEAISAVAADIGGVGSTHINHLTPRVLDIDDLYATMGRRGIQMIDAIQGPPAWPGPDVLLRQTSFRALAEPRMFREADGSVGTGALRVRFGEVEARGIALTPAGREVFDAAMLAVDGAGGAGSARAARTWAAHFPDSETGLRTRGLGYFSYRIADDPPRVGEVPSTLDDLVEQGWVAADPIVYEDFLPRSAAGIFSSNLTARGSVDEGRDGVDRNLDWLAGQIGRDIRTPEELYQAQSDRSVAELAARVGRPIAMSPADPSGSRR